MAEIKPFYVRLPADLHEMVKVRSAQDDRTMAQTVRRALRFYLEHTEPVPSPQQDRRVRS